MSDGRNPKAVNPPNSYPRKTGNARMNYSVTMFANPARSLLGATKHSRLSAPIRSLSSARQPNSPPKNPEQDAKPVAAKDSSQKQA
ncbi:37S ribosomal protein S10 [Penicillium chermesinum]|uniref:37S ribosomal protein S10 n=1 Tax=Penicillium chermesinum TaxID=63820 RepID=A0A9W9PHH0_9EURO|nr:37S ribosomal protein S10 [Penicillium chermesinum]KAJ5246931.1 37S ribosomal protein S10 [Penicillium chermesinum]